MPERHDIFQDNAPPGVASAAASSVFPQVNSIARPSRRLRGRACRSPSCARAVFATLASITAVVVLVLLCSRVYKGRPVQDLRSRRLANSEGSGESTDACSAAGDEEGQKQRQRLQAPNPPAERQRSLPLKKALLARVADTVDGADDGSIHQHEQQRNRQDLASVSAYLSSHKAPGREIQFSASPVPFPSMLPSERTPTELDAAKGLLTLSPHQQGAGTFAPGASTGEAATLEVWRLRRQMRRLQRQVQRERPRVQRQLQRLKQQLHRVRRNRQQLQAQVQQVEQSQERVHEKQRHDLLWQQHQQMQYLLQQYQLQHLLEQRQQLPVMQPLEQQLLAQQQGQQQSLLEQQRQYLPQKDQERRQAVQQQPQQAAAQECGEQHGRRKRKREQQEDPAPNEQWQHQSNQSSEQLEQQLLEDEWAEGGSSRPESPEPSTSQQASAAAAAAGVSTAPPMNIPVIGGTPQASVAAAGTGTSRDEAAASASSHAGGAAAASTAAVHGPQAAGRSSLALTTAGESMNVEVQTTSVSVVGETIEGAGTATAGTADMSASGSTAAMTVLPQTLEFAPPSTLGHPFVRLPRRIDETVPAPFLVDLRGAVATSTCRRDLVQLLQEAHDLLARDVLYFAQARELAHVAGAMIAHAMHHQHQDLSHLKMSWALPRLGMRFLLLDAVVSAFIVLGQTPEAKYWERFTSTINHAPPLGHHPRNYAVQVSFGYILAQQLSKAMQILKTGKRPNPEDLLQIKRMLICAPCSPPRFRRPDFDRWRRDNDSNADGQQVLLPGTHIFPTPNTGGKGGATEGKH